MARLSFGSDRSKPSGLTRCSSLPVTAESRIALNLTVEEKSSLPKMGTFRDGMDEALGGFLRRNGDRRQGDRGGKRQQRRRVDRRRGDRLDARVHRGRRPHLAG